MSRPYDLAVFIGRFQPVHDGHVRVMLEAANIADKVLILVGSSNRAPDTRNPFNFDMRSGMIWDALTAQVADDADRFTTAPLPDFNDQNDWIAAVQQAVAMHTGPQVAPRVCIIGHERDKTSAYLKWFPQWGYVGLDDPDGINATSIRDRLLMPGSQFDQGYVVKSPVCDAVLDTLTAFKGTDAWSDLRAEHEAEAQYKLRWGDKEPHLTADAVVIQSGHVLVIRRGQYPGKGALALPGGFKERGETLLTSAMRELREETSLDLSDAVLRIFLRGSDVFDDPNRSRRGEIVTQAFYFKLPDGPLPQVKGADDAAEAFWLPISEVRHDKMFEDHSFIIQRALAQIDRTS